MKLTVAGAGGFRTPAIYRALLAAPADVTVDELVLYDPAADRLERIGAVLRGI